jgi:hypothetical protein
VTYGCAATANRAVVFTLDQYEPADVLPVFTNSRPLDPLPPPGILI